jgi:hypothetical protein
MTGSALNLGGPEPPPPAPRMSFPAIQFAGWIGWAVGLLCVQMGAAVAFIIMPAALEGHRDASIMGGTLFLGGCLAAFGANHALNALQRAPGLVTRWFSSCTAGLALASATIAMAGFKGGAALLGDLGAAPGTVQAAVGLLAVPPLAMLVIVGISVFRGGVLKRVEPVKIVTGAKSPQVGRWIRRGGGLLVLILSGWSWWSFRPPAVPSLKHITARGNTLEHWHQQWRESGHTAGVEAFVLAGDDGVAAAASIGTALLGSRVRSRAASLRSLRTMLSGGLDALPPLTPVVLERDVSEPVVRVLARTCAAHDDAAALLRRFVAEHDSPPIQVRAFVGLVEGKRLTTAEDAAWIRGLLTGEPAASLRTLLELRLNELGG